MPFFGCGNAVAGEVLPLARREQADRGDPILHQGDGCNSCYFVVFGTVGYFVDDSFNDPTLAEGYKIVVLDV